MNRNTIIAAFFALVFLGGQNAIAQSGYNLFQKGLVQERVKGDLDEAIKFYERIIVKFPNDRPVVAKALLHIGLCYEKMGKQEAQKAYQRIIRGYADQHEVVAEARTRLSRLTRLASVVQAEDIVIRKFMDASGAGFHGAGEPSPDGKYFCFVDWETSNDIVIKEIGTGEEIRLRNKIDLNYEGDVGTPYFPTWSPDSKKIAYTWESDEGEYIELRVIEIDNPEPDVLIRVSYLKGWVTAADWSPDGQHILVLLSENDKDQLGLISIVDSSFHLLKKFDYSMPTSAKFSPDGYHIAYDLPPNEESTNHDIHVLSVDASRQTKLTSHPSHDYLLDWSPTGEKILFASDRTGRMDVWSISFDEVAPQGEPKLITENIGLINPLGCTRNGSFYFSTPGSWWDIYTVTIDPETGKIVESPTEVPLPYQGYNKHPALSPNGKYLAYISMRGHLRPPRDDILCIYTIETGTFKEFDSDISIPRWFPDSQSILVNDTDVLKMDTGEITPFIQEKEGQAVYSPSIFPDKKYLYYVRGDKNSKINSIISRDLKTGKERELYRTPDDNITTALSPDGKQLALLSRHKENTRILKILSTMNGSEKDIHKFKLKEYRYISTAWSPDGRYIYFSKRTDSEDKWGLWRIPATGGTAENLGVKMHGFASLSIHPDGRHITFASFVGLEKPGGIWVMENFLPEAPVAKPAHKPNFRKIRIPTKPQNGVLSPDGNKLAFMSDDAVWVVPLHGKVHPDIAGEPVRLAELKGIWEASGMMAWSADGKWIAVYGQSDMETRPGGSVRVIPVAGGKPRVVQLPEQGSNLLSYRLSLSPDGQVLVFSALELGKPREEVSDSHDRYIYTIPTAGGKLKQVSSDWARMPSFSPDGEFIAYVAYRKREAWQKNTSLSRFHGDLWVVPSAGGTPVKLATVDGRLRGPVWSPDGKYIAAHHEPGGSNNSKEIWVFPLSPDASSAGEPEKIALPHSSWRNMLAGWTPDNELGVFISTEEQCAMYTVPASGGRAMQITLIEWPDYPRWSPDGERIYFRGRFDKEDKVPILYVPSEGGDPVQVPPVQLERRLVSRVPNGGHNVSPDGKRIVISTPNGIWTIPLDGGLPTRLTSGESFEGLYPCWSPNGRTIAFTEWNSKYEDEVFYTIYVIPADGGEISQITSEADRVGGGAIAFSPDGERIAFFSGGAIKTIPIEGGQRQVLVTDVKSGRYNIFRKLAYSPDGSKIAHNAGAKIWITSLGGGEPEELRTGLPENAKLIDFGWSPDGKKIAFIALIGGEEEFWLVENFLPDSNAGE